MDQLGTTLEIKAVRFQDRIISGYASIFNNEDLVGDIVDPGAFSKTLAEKPPSQVAVFIGHKTNELPVGVPMVLRVDFQGLYSETKIFPGPMGDQLLETAKGLSENGLKLGMSIGYRLREGKPERSKQGGYAKRLMDIDLREYSFAAAQTIANPLALTTSVKTADQVTGEITTALAVTDAEEEIKASVGSFAWTRGLVANAIRAKAGSSYIVEMFPDRVIYRVYGTGTGEEAEILYECSYSIKDGAVTMGEPTQVDVQYVPMVSKTTQEVKAMPYQVRKSGDEWCVFDDAGKNRGCSPTEEMAKRHMAAMYANEKDDMPMKKDLPNSAYLYVEPGEDDEQGLRVPRAKRHFPYRTADGQLDATALETAIKTIPSATIEGVKTSVLLARAQRYLEAAHGLTKTINLEAPEWLEGASIELSAMGDELRKTAETLAGEHAAMRLLGDDTKDYRRIRPETRARLDALADQIKALTKWAELADAGAERQAAVARYTAELALLEI